MRRKTFLGLFINDFTERIWLLFVSSLASFFYFTVSVLYLADSYLSGSGLMSGKELSLARYSLFNAFSKLHEAGGDTLVPMAVAAALCAFTAFSFLSDTRKTDFCHSLPVKREEIFLLKLFVSLIDVLLPYLFFASVSAFICSQKSGYGGTFAIAFTGFLENAGFFVLMYAAAVLMMLLAGTRLAGLAGILIVYTVGPLFVYAIQSLMQNYFHSFYYRDEIFKPFYRALSPLFWGESGAYAPSAPQRAIVAYIAGIILLAAGAFIYRMRKSESSGRALAFRKTEVPVKILLVAAAGLSFRSFFGSEDDMWALFGLLSGAVVSGLLIEIVYNLDFRSILKGKGSLLCGIFLALAVFAVFRFDFIGFDSFVPAAEEVESAGFYTYLLDSGYIDESSVELSESETGLRLKKDSASDVDIVNRMRIEDIEPVIAIAENGVETLQKGVYDSNFWHFDGEYGYVLICWRLSDGRTRYRRYEVDLKKCAEDLFLLSDDSGYKEGIYPILSRGNGYSDTLSAAAYEDILGYHELPAGKEELSELFDTYAAELSALDSDTRLCETPLCGLQFQTEEFRNIIERILSDKDYGYYIYNLRSIGMYPVYPSFGETIALLKDLGIDPVNPIDISSVEYITIDNITAGDDEFSYENSFSSLMVTDSGEIAEILSASCSPNVIANELRPVYYGLNITAGFSGSSVSGLYFGFETVPLFVKEYFGITDEELGEARKNQVWWE